MLVNIDTPSVSPIPHGKPLLAASLLALAVSYVSYRLRRFIQPSFRSNVRNLPGPPNASFWFGNAKEIFSREDGQALQLWRNTFGSTFVYRLFWGQTKVFLADPAALHHVLVTDSYAYPKPVETIAAASSVLGKGLLLTEGDVHRRQRKIMGMPFTQRSVETYLPIFGDAASKLCKVIDGSVADANKKDATSWAMLDMLPLLSRSALDIIGEAGFAHDFGALDYNDSQLAQAFASLSSSGRPSWPAICFIALASRFPVLMKLPTKQLAKLKASLATMESEGHRMLAEREDWAKQGELESKVDLLSLIYKASVQESSARNKLYDDEIMGQITTFIVAGHETSAMNLSWTLIYLAKNLSCQVTARDEIRQAKAASSGGPGSALSAEEIGRLPYLDAIVREVMRLRPPIVGTNRVAAQDDTIPLSQHIIGKDGKPISHIAVQRGQGFFLGIRAYNTSKEIFGEDAESFKPERWLDGTVHAKQHEKNFTTWGNHLSFLGGPRGCLGYRFALLEIKTVLAEMLDRFEFAERDEYCHWKALSRFPSIMTRPYLQGQEEAGPSVPLKIRRAL